MLLGQLVAISVASNLFHVALLLSSAPKVNNPDNARKPPPWTLWLSVLVSLMTVGHSPYTTEKTFLPNLLTMHAIIIIPLLLPTAKVVYKTRGIYNIVGWSSVALHTRTTIRTFAALPEASHGLVGFAHSAWQTIHSHPAQSSITWDVIWTLISFGTWLYLSPLEPYVDHRAVEKGKLGGDGEKKE